MVHTSTQKSLQKNKQVYTNVKATLIQTLYFIVKIAVCRGVFKYNVRTVCACMKSCLFCRSSESIVYPAIVKITAFELSAQLPNALLLPSCVLCVS